MSFEFMNIKHSESFTTLKGQNIDVEQEWCKKVLSPPQNILIPKECVVDVVNEIGHANYKRGPVKAILSLFRDNIILT